MIRNANVGIHQYESIQEVAMLYEIKSILLIAGL